MNKEVASFSLAVSIMGVVFAAAITGMYGLLIPFGLAAYGAIFISWDPSRS